jgi:hypothetical protein
MISTSKINAILQTEDPEGLLQLGAPSDEYFSEAKRIAASLKSLPGGILTAEGVSTAIETVWQSSFGPFTEEDIANRRPYLRRIARRIVDELESE